MNTPDPRPGFFIIERYMPDASVEEQEEAYASLREYIGILMRIQDRVNRERDSTNPDWRHRIPEDV